MLNNSSVVIDGISEEITNETTNFTKEQDEVINRFAAEMAREEKARKD